MNRSIFYNKAYNEVLKLLFFCFLMTFSTFFAQVEVGFQPRKSNKAPIPYTNVSNYYLQGDFTMIGNTNLTLANYDSSTNNSNNAMVFVDVDNDNSTVNSSSADLTFPNPACTEIIYAGLYWSGRSETQGNASMSINGRNKNQIKFKKDGSGYTTITANTISSNPEIRYPGTSNGYMFAAYADVTDYIINHGAGTYFAADLALVTGNGGDTGYYGGWGLVVVYKDTSLPWRNITVFDGYAYVPGSTTASYELPVSGFTAVQNGNVRTTIGMMAGEGDVGISGDYFQIRNSANTSWVSLNHSSNTTTNFFNSSINVGNFPKNPNLANNTGLDIAKFDLPNTNNTLIGNNQTSTRFKYGTTQDTYIIYSIVFAVDAYVPVVEGYNHGYSFNGSTVTNGGNIVPGQEYGMQLDMYNKGTETINNTKISIPIPYNHYYTGYSIVSGLDITASNSSVTWIPPVGAPLGANSTTTPGGTLEWNIGSLPLHTKINDLLGSLQYRLKVSNDCSLLLTSSCNINPQINGKITGIGSVSQQNLNSEFTNGYGSQACPGPIFGDLNFNIILDQAFIDSCKPKVENNVTHYIVTGYISSNMYPRSDIVSDFPEGTKFPSSYNQTTNLITGDFPVPLSNNSVNTYYAVVPGMPDGCYLVLDISRTICYDTSALGIGEATQVGITSLTRNTSTWPMSRKSGFIALKSNSKGFVITRTTPSSIAVPQEGMMIFDTSDNSLKIYSDGSWKKFDKPTCP